MSLDYSIPTIPLSKDQAWPDVYLPWIPDRLAQKPSTLSLEVLKWMRQAILAQIPRWISTPNRVTENLPDIQTVLLADISTFEKYYTVIREIMKRR